MSTMWKACALALAAGAILVPASFARADDDNHQVRIINETKFAMVAFYASNVSENDWQDDILGKSLLTPGQDVIIDIDDGTGHCHYDFKAVFSDGSSSVREDINVCQVEYYRYE